MPTGVTTSRYDINTGARHRLLKPLISRRSGEEGGHVDEPFMAAVGARLAHDTPPLLAARRVDQARRKLPATHSYGRSRRRARRARASRRFDAAFAPSVRANCAPVVP